jgi:hypothetical protein
MVYLAVRCASGSECNQYIWREQVRELLTSGASHEQYWNASSALWSKPVDSWLECSNSDDPGGCTKSPKCSDYIKQVRVSSRAVASCQQVNVNGEKTI